MSFLDSIGTSVFGMCVVFVVLIALSLVISLQTMLVKTFKVKHGATGQNDVDSAENTIAAAEAEQNGGELKLADVDEKTAAMIMAIVSHESQIPLSELQFKSIKAADKKK